MLEKTNNKCANFENLKEMPSDLTAIKTQAISLNEANEN